MVNKVDNAWIEVIRREKGMTHEEVASQSGITRTYYTMIANGRRPSVDVAKRIASALGFDWSLFYEQKRNETLPTKNSRRKKAQ